MMMENIYALSQDQLGETLTLWKVPKFRSKQVWNWLYDKRVDSFQGMKNIPQSLRTKLEENFCLGTAEVDIEQKSDDGTIKRLYRLPDGALIEAVLMPYRDGRRTACISSQVGCAMGCRFCATGQMGFVRQLRAEEIFEQAFHYSQILQAKQERLSNIVLMGMGEPFHNYDAVLQAIAMIRERLGIGARRITLSTVGLAPKIRKFADEGTQINLAISLHSTDNEARSALMPINKRYNLEELIDSCRYYAQKTNRRITFEWAHIAGQNDDLDEAHRLGKLLRGLDCHVNIIPLNPTAGFEGAPSFSLRPFIEVLARYGVVATVRVRRGIDIDAGCGQLKSKKERKVQCSP